MKKPNTKRLAKIMKALANEHRLAIYLGIAKGKESDFEAAECSVCDVVKKLTLAAPTISHHLKELANADLIVTEKRGKYVVAKINQSTLDEVEQVLTLVRGG
jgi:ArsR family transcriptional regulator